MAYDIIWSLTWVTYHQTTGRPPSVSGGFVDWNLSNNLLLFIEEIHMNNTVAIICSKMQNLEQILNESLKKMLTESCVMFFSPSRAVLSAIFRNEYLTSAVRTKELDKPGSNQPPVSDPVQFKLELTPNCLISYLENTSSRSTRYVSMLHLNESSILPKFLEKSDPEVARPAFSTWPVQKISTKGIWGMRVDSNPLISVSRPLAVQNRRVVVLNCQRSRYA